MAQSVCMHYRVLIQFTTVRTKSLHDLAWVIWYREYLVGGKVQAGNRVQGTEYTKGSSGAGWCGLSVCTTEYSYNTLYQVRTMSLHD